MKPILIAGPTASGKSALALALAARTGASIINADALQVYANWRVLTARPDAEEETHAPHLLYGHVATNTDYSTGQWLREIRDLLAVTPRAIIVGGTGLNFTALTQGLADIPPTPPEIRAEADALGPAALHAELSTADPETFAKIDTANPMRIQRAWEVLRTTGRGLTAWHALTPPPLVPRDTAAAIVLKPDIPWLNDRIERRFDQMLSLGALDEARSALPDWQPQRPSSKAIGAPELIAHLRGEMSLEDARSSAIIASRQYAKRQRTWFRNRMKDWTNIPFDQNTNIDEIAGSIAERA
ncbi:tRNA dimethylallyltransferase [Monaibacterium marinum]|uniref:tRNA dimethylallyltransferase n=1 Tax=Pontivivens marinum TaxID=1690039 RepID=A0A2C9CQY3_9RHOB|nr:tRNA (adenosine(37)-N6)-dimethylallyltransferase MiaA [Monaibacterium marinum]SOH93585.1 tRNA dimethylallyltransferase [Monaibacterium marinum]